MSDGESQNSPVHSSTGATGAFVAPVSHGAARSVSFSPASLTMEDLITFIKLDPRLHADFLKVISDPDMLFCQTGRVPDIEKALSFPLGSKLDGFGIFTLATKIDLLGQYLAYGLPWHPGLSLIEVQAMITTERRKSGAVAAFTTSPSPITAPSPTTVPTLSESSGTKLRKIFDKQPWDGAEETYPEWKEAITDTLRLMPKALAHYHDPGAAADDPDLALITYNALLSAVSNSDAHDVLKELPVSQWTGYHAWLALEDTMEGDDQKEHYQTLAETKLKSLHKDSLMSVLQLRGKLDRIFALYKAADLDMTEEAKMKTLCRKMKEDDDFKAIADQALLEIRDKKLAKLDDVTQRFKYLEDENRFQDLNSCTSELNEPRDECRTTTTDYASASDASSKKATFQSGVEDFCIPPSIWKAADTRMRLSFVNWKHSLSNASSFKEVQSLKLPTAQEVEAFKHQQNQKHSPDSEKKKPAKGKKHKFQAASAPCKRQKHLELAISECKWKQAIKKVETWEPPIEPGKRHNNSKNKFLIGLCSLAAFNVYCQRLPSDRETHPEDERYLKLRAKFAAPPVVPGEKVGCWLSNTRRSCRDKGGNIHPFLKDVFVTDLGIPVDAKKKSS